MARGEARRKTGAGRRGPRFIDRLALFTAWLLSCGVVYVLGLYVGKGLHERRLLEEERVIRLPVTPGEQEPPREELSFYRTLGEGGRRRSAAAGSAGGRRGAARGAGDKAAPRAASAGPEGGARPDASRSGATVWSVQVDATRRPAEAQTRMRELRARGYDAYLVKVNIRGQTWYRVRVGHYRTLERANEMVVHLKEREGPAHAFVCSG